MKNADTNNDTGAAKLSTAQLLVATGFPCLKRHTVTGEYYGVKKHLRKIKQVKLRTEDDRPVSERRLAEKLVRAWVDGLGKEAACGPRTMDEQLAVFCRANGSPTLEEVAEYESRNEGKRGAEREPSIIPNNRKNVIWALRRMKASWRLDYGAPISKVRTSDVSAFLASQTDLRAASFNELSRQLKNVFQLAVDDGVLSASPYDGVPVKQRRRRMSREPATIPTRAQFEAIVAEIRNPEWEQVKGKRGGQRPMHFPDSADLAEFLGLAALGEAEAAPLKWAEIDFERGEMRVFRLKTKTYFIVPIYPRLRPFLERMHERKGRPRGSERVFAVACCKRAIGAACRKLRLPHFSPRSFRKMGITEFLRAGVNVKLVAKWQGHRDGGKLILDTYTDVISAADTEHERAELGKLAA